MAIDMNIYELLVIGDSDFLTHQVQGEWAVKNPKIIPYIHYVQKLRKRFYYIDPLDIELKEHPVHCSCVEAEPDGLPWRTPDLGLLKCVDAFEATELFEQIHTGVCGPHMNGLTLARKILRAAWGMDVIGTIEPATSNGYRFILVAIDYFTKWVEATFYKSVTNKVVADFVRKNLYAVSEYQMNGAVEASNKNIKKILRKMIDNHRGWHEMFPYALLGYRTTVIISIGATPYLLVYGTKAVIPAEVKILSVSIIKEVEFSNAEWRMIRAFHKRVRARIFEVGQLVLQRIFPHQDEYKGKFAPNWQGPYMVRKVLSGGVLVLSEMDGTVWPKPINTYALKRYCV
ncbi:uncharacterized protein [Solanum lycopersicum]|uniref:uncharacterized protein n=1 Tax=Solanum lycopersicum TaxID=4081 RepID=UPI0037480275